MKTEKKAVTKRQEKMRLFEQLADCRVSLSGFYSGSDEPERYTEYITVREGKKVTEITNRVYSYLYSKRFLLEEISLPLVTKKKSKVVRDFRFLFENKLTEKSDKRPRNVFVFDRNKRQFRLKYPQKDDSISTDHIRSVSSLYKRYDKVLIQGKVFHLSKDVIFYYCSVVFFGDNDKNALRESFRKRRLRAIFECMQLVLLDKYEIKFEIDDLMEELWKEINSPKKMTLTLKLQKNSRLVLLGTVDGAYDRTIELIHKKLSKDSEISYTYGESVTDLPFGDNKNRR